jgi:PASTA domain
VSGRLIASLVLAVSLAACSAEGTPEAASTDRGPQNGPMDVHRPVASGSGATAAASAAAASAPGAQAANGDASEGSGEGVGPTGPPAAVVPDVEGLVFGSAVRRLWRAGIGVQLVLARSSREPLYDVIEQDPPAGSNTPSAGLVNIVLSLHRTGGAGVLGTVACKPEMDELDDPYCLGKLLKY